jgi:hypothetical protein
VADYPGQRIPPKGAVTTCATCDAPIVFNPARPNIAAPKICMQCAHIQPLPFD